MEKKLFRKYLIDAITRNDEKDFEGVVQFIGIQWGVIRTVPKDDKATDFVDNLWENKKKDSFWGIYRLDKRRPPSFL